MPATRSQSHRIGHLDGLGLADARRGVGHFVTGAPEIRRVRIASGSTVVVRMPQPGEGGGLAYAVYVVAEPGKPTAVYDLTCDTLVRT
jgi:hypothetical protein